MQGTIHNEHNGKGVVLFDGCPRCEEQAARPFETLDDSSLKRLLRRLENMDDYGTNDRRAIIVIHDVKLKAMRLT